MGDKKVYKCGDIVVRHCDLDTLEGPRLLNDQIIAFYFAYLSSSFNTKTKTDMLLVTPSISLWIANCGDDKSVEDYVQSCEMSSKRLVLFVINDNDDFGGGDSGSHWSILVYDRMKNLFLHFDSIKGLNNPYAVKLYDALKQFMGPGGESSSPHTSSSLLKKKQRKKKKSVPYVNRGSKATVPPVTRESEATPLAGLPMFNECETAPQQFNGYDCGMYVLAIARAICQWCSHEHNRSDISTIEKNVVSSSVENNMRDEEVAGILISCFVKTSHFEEYLCVKASNRVQMTEDELILHFFQFDEAGQASISLRDLRRVAADHDFDWSDKEMADMIHIFDSDGDGKLSLEDFRTIVGRCQMIQPVVDSKSY